MHGQMEWPSLGELAKAKARKRWRRQNRLRRENRLDVEPGNRGNKEQLLELVDLLLEQYAA